MMSLTGIAADSAVLKVLSWNIHHASGLDNRLDLERVAKIINEAQPDVVMLQEVDVNVKRSQKQDQMQRLAQLTQMHAIFGAAIPLQGGEYGQGLLSKHPLREVQVLALPSKGEQRIVVSAITNSPWGEIRVATVHLDHQSDDVRQRQVEALRDAFQKKSVMPTILAGDLNATPQALSWKQMTKTPWNVVEKTGEALTYPADQPKIEIDYILALHVKAKATSKVLPEAVASDHRPVLGELQKNFKSDTGQ